MKTKKLWFYTFIYKSLLQVTKGLTRLLNLRQVFFLISLQKKGKVEKIERKEVPIYLPEVTDEEMRGGGLRCGVEAKGRLDGVRGVVVGQVVQAELRAGESSRACRYGRRKGDANARSGTGNNATAESSSGPSTGVEPSCGPGSKTCIESSTMTGTRSGVESSSATASDDLSRGRRCGAESGLKVNATGQDGVLVGAVVDEEDLGVGGRRRRDLDHRAASDGGLPLVEDVDDILLLRRRQHDGFSRLRLLGSADEDHVVLHLRGRDVRRRTLRCWLIGSREYVHMTGNLRD